MESDLGDLKDESELHLIGQVGQRCRRVPSAGLNTPAPAPGGIKSMTSKKKQFRPCHYFRHHPARCRTDPGASLTVREKVEIAHQLARLNVDVIEAGFPISSGEDFEAVRRIAHEVEGPIICGLSRAIGKDIDRAGEALKSAPNPRIHTFIGTSPITPPWSENHG